MSSLYSDHKQQGDRVYHGFPPIDGGDLSDIRTGPPVKIHFVGVSGSGYDGYIAEFTIGHSYHRVYESNLRDAFVRSMIGQDVEVLEVPVTGGRPRQDSVKLGFNDISYALERMNQCLPKRSKPSSPSMDGIK